ncbi:DDT domain [Macleaya cordata]|uniref:DDT domain n=1 Tax=Macleaya cordata TaxID=56857 RepID=A0A200Q3J3_MACCD|nr:DDT domain [Macleaya cordata]
MAVSTNSPSKPKNETTPNKHTKMKSTEVNVLEEKIDDSANRKTCHQCRQRTANLMAYCKNQRSNNNKLCPFKFCYRCLLNRYGEKADEVALLDNWKCPKCRDVCNCSNCMKKKGHQPTGVLVRTAKATGFSSVSEMLIAKGPEILISANVVKDVGTSPKKSDPSTKEQVVKLPITRGKENSSVGNCEENEQVNPLKSDTDAENGESKQKVLGTNDANGNVDQGSADESLKLETKSTKNYCVLEEINLKPIKKAKKIKGRDDGAISKENGRKKPRISKETPPNDTKKEVRVSEVDNVGVLEKKDSQNSEETSVASIEQEGKINKREDSLLSSDEKEVPDQGNNCNGQVKLKSGPVIDKVKKKAKRILNEDSDIDIPLPQGIVLTAIADIDLPAEDVGPALQFLEFCKAFGKVFDMKKGQPESLLRELTCGSSRLRRRQCSPIIRFQIQLLSLIQKNLGEESTLSPTSSGKLLLQALQKCISASRCKLEELPQNCFDMGDDVYDLLDSSKKLRILNFLCDEALCTVDLRTWIDKQNSKFVERKREATQKVLAAKDKEKRMKQKIQDEMAKAIILKNGASLSIAERDDLLSTLKVEAEKAHAEVMEAIHTVTPKKQKTDFVRTQPVLLDGNGHVFWRLTGYSHDSDILLQDIGSWDSVTSEEKWFTYDIEQKQAVESCISSLSVLLGYPVECLSFTAHNGLCHARLAVMQKEEA